MLHSGRLWPYLNRDKHSSLLRKPINYDRKKFYSAGTEGEPIMNQKKILVFQFLQRETILLRKKRLSKFAALWESGSSAVVEYSPHHPKVEAHW